MFLKNAYLIRRDTTNPLVKKRGEPVVESTWHLVDHEKQDLGYGPFPSRKAASSHGKSHGYYVHGMYPSGVIPGEEDD